MRLQLSLAPLPCPRPRITAKPFPHAYYPADYKAWKTEAAKAIRKLIPKSHRQYDFPVRVTIACSVKRPKSTKLVVPKPDVDNYAKSILDALTAAEVWTDDTIVGTLVVSKRWAPEAGIEILIEGEYIP